MAINREASHSDAGFRLQKLRAIQLILTELRKEKEAVFWCSLEQGADVTFHRIEDLKSKVYEEEDKHYSPESSFTLNSTQILNTFVIFLDRLFEERLNPNLKFGFFSTNRIGKERATSVTENLGVEFNGIKVLKELTAHNFNIEVIEIASKLILEEYRVQYKNREDGVYVLIKEWDNNDWISFFKRITFKFNQAKIDKLHQDLCSEVKKCHHFSSTLHMDKEELILGALLDKVEQLQHKQNYSARFVRPADIELIFLKARGGELTRIDPANEAWEEVITSDGRTIDQKITEVCVDDSVALIKSLKRKAAVGSSLVSKNSMDKSLKAALFRIYDHVEDEINAKGDSILQMTTDDVSNTINDLTESSFKILNSVNKDFCYSVRSKESVRDLVLHLFDSCYLAFNRKT